MDKILKQWYNIIIRNKDYGCDFLKPVIKKDFTAKIAVMYITDKFKEPIPDDVLTEIAGNICGINYFILKQCEYELIQSEFLTSRPTGHEEYYSLTEKGKQALDFFATKLLYTLRTEIDEYIKNYAPKKKDDKFVCDYTPVTEKEFNVLFEYYEEELPMLKLEFRGGDRAQSAELTRMFRKKKEMIYTDIYKYIMKIAAELPEHGNKPTPNFDDDDTISFFEE